MPISQNEYRIMQQRLGKRGADEIMREFNQPCDDESKLQQQILDHCAANKWVCERSRMDKKTTGQPGYPDFVISADGGRTFYVECKKKGGKLSINQRNFLYWLTSLGHKAFVVWSFEDYLREIGA